jgi:transcriptional regulator with XRE-family HTH domain
MNFGKAVRIARSIAGMSQDELAAGSSIDRSYLSLIESGRRKPTIETLKQISDAMNIPFHLLTLLATEREDANRIDEGQVQRLATELTRLLLEEKPGDVRRTRQAVGRKPERSRVSSRNRKKRITRAA